MFFYWRAGYKHFKQGDNLSGQIFPFLLICIVGLLVAVGISIRAGSSAKSRTCVSNAADAGSLAVGSGAAGAFNELVTRNKEMEDYYLLNLAYYTILHELAQGYLDEGIDFSEEAQSLAYTALNYINTPVKSPDSDCTVWMHQKNGADTNTLAALQVLEARKCFRAFNILTIYMQYLTDNFKINQTGNYCNDRVFMDQSLKDAKSTGFSYAFSNSCTSSRAPDGDAFGLWLGTSKYKDDPSFEKTPSEATYKWTWPSKCGISECGITVTLDLPEITSYKLKHTKWNYPEKKSLIAEVIPFVFAGPDGEDYLVVSDDPENPDDPFNYWASLCLSDIMDDIHSGLMKYAEDGMKIYDASVEQTKCCPDLACKDFSPLYEAATTLANMYKCLYEGLDALNKEKAGILSARILKTLDQSIFDNVWHEDKDYKVSDNFSSETCEDVQDYIDESGYPGLMIIDINDEPEFLGPPNPWQTKCTVTSFCNNIHVFSDNMDKCVNSATTRTSTSEFHGKGELKTFEDNYEAEIIGTN